MFSTKTTKSTKSTMLVLRGSSVSRANSVVRELGQGPWSGTLVRDQGSKAGSKTGSKAGSRAGSRAQSVEPLCDKTINVFKKAIVQLNEYEQEEEEKFPFVIVNNFVTFNITIGRKCEDSLIQKASSVEDLNEYEYETEYETEYEWEEDAKQSIDSLIPDL